MSLKLIKTISYRKGKTFRVSLGRAAVFPVAVLLSILAAPHALAAPALDEIADGLKVDEKGISVSGISSGAFFAHQFHVVHSRNIMGAGIVAGGPYYCSKGTVMDSITKCSQLIGTLCEAFMDLSGMDKSSCEGYMPPKTKEESRKMARESFEEARKRNADIPDGLRGDKIYLFSGTEDEMVSQGVMDAVNLFYTEQAGVKAENVRYNNTFLVHHSMVRDNYDSPSEGAVNECSPPDPIPSLSENTYIYDCQAEAQKQSDAMGCSPSDGRQACLDLGDIDLAGAILKHIHGEEALANGRRIVDEEKELQTFDQRKVFKRFSSTPNTDLQLASMARDGYVFIPEKCKEGAECTLHVAFHGCLQGGRTDKRRGKSGNLYAKFAGYNEWAKANNIVVLYPQVEGRQVLPPMNPQGCWDWWGQNYTHEKFHTKHGPQMKAVGHMINILLGDSKDIF